MRQALFAWFIDVREALKGRLPKRLFKMKARELYAEWLVQNETPVIEQMKFGNEWVRQWETEYGVSLRKPNKHYTLSKDDLCVRIKDYLKNVWTVRNFFLKKFGVDPPVINGDQMPLHRDESGSQKTMSFKNLDAYVKENYSLTRERATVYTQVSSDPTMNLIPEFIFKGKGTRTKLNAPDGVKVQWSDSGSYRLEHMLNTIGNLPNRNNNPFSKKDWAIYVLDNYAVHLMPEIRKALWARGYVLVLIGGGITGFIQQNDTHIHRPLKYEYRNNECTLMIVKLQADKTKVPSPTRDEMMAMLAHAWNALTVDCAAAFKNLFVTNALDGSEDHLIWDKIFRLVGADMISFRNQLLDQSVPKVLQDVVKTLIPPKGVKRKEYEGTEFFTGFEDFEEPNEEPSRSDESDVSDSEAISGDLPTAAVPDNQPPQPVIVHGTVSLQNIVADEDINKDAKFLDDINKVINDADTSQIFLPQMQKLHLPLLYFFIYFFPFMDFR